MPYKGLCLVAAGCLHHNHFLILPSPSFRITLTVFSVQERLFMLIEHRHPPHLSATNHQESPETVQRIILIPFLLACERSIPICSCTQFSFSSSVLNILIIIMLKILCGIAASLSSSVASFVSQQCVS